MHMACVQVGGCYNLNKFTHSISEMSATEFFKGSSMTLSVPLSKWSVTQNMNL